MFDFVVFSLFSKAFSENWADPLWNLRTC